MMNDHEFLKAFEKYKDFNVPEIVEFLEEQADEITRLRGALEAAKIDINLIEDTCEIETRKEDLIRRINAALGEGGSDG